MKKFFNWFERQHPIAQVGMIAGAGYGVTQLVKAFKSAPAVQLPAGGAGLPVTGYNAQGQAIAWDPRPLSDELYSAMSGLGTFSGTKDEAWSKLANLPTPDMVTAVYNDFNARHGDGSTLTQWIRDEYYYDYFTGVRDATLAKLALLNLP